MFGVGRDLLKSRFSFLVCVLFLVSIGGLSFGAFLGQVAGGQLNGLRVTNVDTGLSYSGIQAAVDASETLDGHTIQVAAGVFMEHVIVSKSVSLVGESPDATILDGGGVGVVVSVTANEVEVRNLSIRNGTFGVRLQYSNNSRILDNKLEIGSYGIRLYHSLNSLVAGNQVSGYSHFGIELDSSGNSTLRNNIMADNKYNFGVDGMSLQDFLNDIDVSNTVNGKPVRYLINQRDLVVDSSSFDGLGYLGFVNSSNIRVRNLDVEKNIQGVLFAFASNSSISSVNARDNWNGIYVVHSFNVSVNDVKSNHNFDYGVKFLNSSLSRAFQNNVDSNGWAGIGLFWSHDSSLDLNEASYCTYDLHVVSTNNSVISGNTALARPGGYSIALYYSHNNLICRNTFEKSLLFAETRNDGSFTPTNVWNSDFEGNHWVSYEGRDADRDGIGDSPYAIGENNVDYYPLMGRFSQFNVVVGGRAYGVTFISNSTVAQFRFEADESRIRFDAFGQNGTLGFCRVAVLAGFLQELEGGGLVFLVNGEEPVLERQWSGGAWVYWYLSFANVSSETTFDPLLIGAFVLLFLIVVGVLLMFLWKRKAD